MKRSNSSFRTEYIGMNKLKWLLLVVYGLYIILLRIPKLAILSKLPIKKDIYILSWYSGLGNNIIQLAQAEYLAEQAGFTLLCMYLRIIS